MGGSGGGYAGGGYGGSGAGRGGAMTGGSVGGGGGGGDEACIFNTNAALASPNPVTVSTLSIADILDIALNAAGASPVVEVRLLTGAVAGSLAGMPRLRELITCLQTGSTYEFEVTSISGGRVEGRLMNS